MSIMFCGSDVLLILFSCMNNKRIVLLAIVICHYDMMTTIVKCKSNDEWIIMSSFTHMEADVDM